MNELIGLPDNPAYQLDMKARSTQDLDFWERLYNTYISTVATVFGYYYIPKYKATMDRFFNYTGWESRPSFMELVSNRSIVLTNSHPAIGYPVPLAPHRKEIGGVNIVPNKPLPQVNI